MGKKKKGDNKPKKPADEKKTRRAYKFKMDPKDISDGLIFTVMFYVLQRLLSHGLYYYHKKHISAQWHGYYFSMLINDTESAIELPSPSFKLFFAFLLLQFAYRKYIKASPHSTAQKQVSKKLETCAASFMVMIIEDKKSIKELQTTIFNTIRKTQGTQDGGTTKLFKNAKNLQLNFYCGQNRGKELDKLRRHPEHQQQLDEWFRGFTASSLADHQQSARTNAEKDKTTETTLIATLIATQYKYIVRGTMDDLPLVIYLSLTLTVFKKPKRTKPPESSPPQKPTGVKKSDLATTIDPSTIDQLNTIYNRLIPDKKKLKTVFKQSKQNPAGPIEKMEKEEKYLLALSHVDNLHANLGQILSAYHTKNDKQKYLRDSEGNHWQKKTIQRIAAAARGYEKAQEKAQEEAAHFNP